MNNVYRVPVSRNLEHCVYQKVLILARMQEECDITPGNVGMVVGLPCGTFLLRRRSITGGTNICKMSRLLVQEVIA